MVTQNPHRIIRPDCHEKHVRRRCYYYPPEMDPEDQRPITLGLILSIAKECDAIGRDAFGVVIRLPNSWAVVNWDVATGEVAGLERYGDLEELNRVWELD